MLILQNKSTWNRNYGVYYYNISEGNSIRVNTSQRGAPDSVADTSVLSNPADTQNVFCLGLCGSDVCPKTS